jgi:UDPglucose--hexose-1-phosphate uridylyltransferase
VDLADHILSCWRPYSDPSVDVLAETAGVPHNTITPIARCRDGVFELDLTLRNNRTTEERPLGLFHPAPVRHHIKKENIGLIEVMGLAILPARLKQEIFGELREALLSGGDLHATPTLDSHSAWAGELRAKYGAFDEKTIDSILMQEVGEVFTGVLEDAGVFKRDPAGKEAFLRFARTL